MRWYWIDRFEEFVSGQRAVATKNVSLAEEQLDGYLPGYPCMPSSLIVEGMAQTGGLLVAQASDFKERVVLAKISKATFERVVRPGDKLRYTATIDSIQPGGALVRGECHCEDEPLAQIDLFFAHLDERIAGDDLFDPLYFIAMLRVLRIFDVGRNPDGSPIQPPAHLRASEQEAVAADLEPLVDPS